MKGCGQVAGGEVGEWGSGWTERPMWTICRPVCSTLSHRDSPVLDSRLLLSRLPFPLLPHLPYRLSYLATPLALWPSIIIIDILYRGLYFIHVSHRGMRLFGILYASPSSPILFFPPSSFFSVGYLIGEITFFPFFDEAHFSRYDYGAEVAGNQRMWLN